MVQRPQDKNFLVKMLDESSQIRDRKKLAERIKKLIDRYGCLLYTSFTFYSLSVAFYMPTVALTNSVAYTALDKVKLDPVIAFPPIRIFGTIGFICSMLLLSLIHI